MTYRPRKIVTVVGDELANVGMMFADLCPVGELAGDCRDKLAAAGRTAKHTRAPLNHSWLAFFTRALSDMTHRSPLRGRLAN